MADAFSSDASAWRKLYSSLLPFSPPALVAGLVQHELLSGSTQVTILRIVDESGSASLGDIAFGLGDHPDATGAVLVMVDLAILVIDYAQVIDQHSVVRRAPDRPDPTAIDVETHFDGADRGDLHKATAADVALPPSVNQLASSTLTPSVLIADATARRSLDKIDSLDRPGVYALVGEHQVYIGASTSVGARIALGQQPIGNIQRIVVVTDANDTLSDSDALAAERMFFSRVEASRAFAAMNALPMGAAVDAQRYAEIDTFLAQACLTLRHHGVLFTESSTRAVLAGPRQENGRVAPLRPFNAIPDGTRLELCFDDGLVALASRVGDHCWVLLTGSDIRIETAASANSSVRFLRSAWLHAGLLEISADGRSLVTTRDLVFRSGSGAAQFCVGSKGRNCSSWVPIDPDGGYDPSTPSLIAA